MAKTPQAQPKAATPAAGYRVASPIEHDGVRYEVDASIELDAETAAPLVARGILLTPIAE